MKKVIAFIKKYPIKSLILATIVSGGIISILYSFTFGINKLDLDDIFIMWFLLSALIIPPIVSLTNLVTLFWVPKNILLDKEWMSAVKKIEIVTIIAGIIYSLLYMEVISDIVWEAKWYETLYNSQMHQPIWTEGILTVVVLSVIGVAGYLALSIIKLEKTPPLILVLLISSMYCGIFECTIWCIQIINTRDWILCVFPANCILIAIKTIRYKILEWNYIKKLSQSAEQENKILNKFSKYIEQAEYWPVIAFILMWPLLGIVLCVLVLFGQRPDCLIKAWTETSDWTLSTQTAPPNLYMDEHYLCTVAAGGHKEVVKPIRMGERHGHRVVVNRQLCIANAFEQILEEKMPRFHRVVRFVYDKYGLPVAKLIKSKCVVDVVYFIMKPLEWFFLIIIYMCDVNPENRIAIQYLPVNMSYFRNI